jgi:hypothetical protein
LVTLSPQPLLPLPAPPPPLINKLANALPHSP